jgi:hypothetical protein
MLDSEPGLEIVAQIEDTGKRLFFTSIVYGSNGLSVTGKQRFSFKEPLSVNSRSTQPLIFTVEYLQKGKIWISNVSEKLTFSNGTKPVP